MNQCLSLRDLNPHSAHSLVRRLLKQMAEVTDAEESVLDKLRDISRSLEDQLEG
jgi:hypothetical protein